MVSREVLQWYHTHWSQGRFYSGTTRTGLKGGSTVVPHALVSREVLQWYHTHWSQGRFYSRTTRTGLKGGSTVVPHALVSREVLQSYHTHWSHRRFYSRTTRTPHSTNVPNTADLISGLIPLVAEQLASSRPLYQVEMRDLMRAVGDSFGVCSMAFRSDIFMYTPVLGISSTFCV